MSETAQSLRTAKAEPKFTVSEFFGRKVTQNLKGILAVGVLLHHIYQKTDIILHESVSGFLFQSLGYYCVSLFFFISGFGLMYSFNTIGGVFAWLSEK